MHLSRVFLKFFKNFFWGKETGIKSGKNAKFNKVLTFFSYFDNKEIV